MKRGLFASFILIAILEVQILLLQSRVNNQDILLDRIVGVEAKTIILIDKIRSLL